MAKKLSLITKGIAVLFAIIGFIFLDRSAGEIVIICTFIAASYLPVDASMIVRNAKGTQ